MAFERRIRRLQIFVRDDTENIVDRIETRFHPAIDVLTCLDLPFMDTRRMAERLQLVPDPKGPVSVARRIADENIRHAPSSRRPRRRRLVMLRRQAPRNSARLLSEGNPYTSGDSRQRAGRAPGCTETKGYRGDRCRQGSRRVQLDGARLQSATGAQHPWRRKADGGRGRMNDAHICSKSGGKSRSESSRRRQGRDRGPDNKNPSKHARRTS
jgi:hypothetical protein